MASSDDFPGDVPELNTTTGSDAVTEEAADEEEGNEKKEENADIPTNKNSCCGFIKIKLSLLEDEIRTQSKDLELIQKEVSEIKAISQEFPPSCVDLCSSELLSDKERLPKPELDFSDKNRQKHAVCDLLGQTHEELTKRNFLAKQLRKEISRFKKYTFEFKNRLQVTNSKLEEKQQQQQQNSNGSKAENCQMCKFCVSHGDFRNASSVKYEESDGSVIEDLQEENEMLKDCLQKIHRKLRAFRFSESLGYKETPEDPHYLSVNENTPLYIESVHNSFENFCEFYCKLQEELFKLRHALMTAEKNSFDHAGYSPYVPDNQAVYYSNSRELKEGGYQGSTREFRERYDRFSDDKVYGNEKKFTRTMKQNFTAVPYTSKLESSGDLIYTDHRHKYLKKENRLQNELLYAQKQLEVLHSKIFEAVQLVRDVELEGNSNETLVEMVASVAEECNALRQEVSYLRKLRQEQRKSWNRLRHFIMDSEKRFEREGRNTSNLGDVVRSLGNMIASSESSSLDEAILYMYNNQLEWLEHFCSVYENSNATCMDSQDNITEDSKALLERVEFQPKDSFVGRKSVTTQTICQCIQQQRHWCKPLLESKMSDVSVQADEFFSCSEMPADNEYDPSCIEVDRGMYVVHEEQEESENPEGNEISHESTSEKPSENVSDSEADVVQETTTKSVSQPTEAQPSSLHDDDTEHAGVSDEPSSEKTEVDQKDIQNDPELLEHVVLPEDGQAAVNLPTDDSSENTPDVPLSEQAVSADEGQSADLPAGDSSENTSGEPLPPDGTQVENLPAGDSSENASSEPSSHDGTQVENLPSGDTGEHQPSAPPSDNNAPPEENRLSARVDESSFVPVNNSQHHTVSSVPDYSQEPFTNGSNQSDSALGEHGHHTLPYSSSSNEVTLYPVRATEGFIPFSLTPNNVSVIQNYSVSNEEGEVITYENNTQSENMVNAVYSFLHKLNDSVSHSIHGEKGNYWNLFLLGTLNTEAFSVSVERNDSPSSDDTESASDAEEIDDSGTLADASGEIVPSELRSSLKYVFYDAFSKNKIEFVTNNSLPCVLYSTSPPGVNVLLPNSLPSNFSLLSQDLNYLTSMPKKLHSGKRSYAIEHTDSHGKVWFDSRRTTECGDSIESWLNPVTHTIYYGDEEQARNIKTLSDFEESLIIVSVVPKLLENINSDVEAKYIVFERVKSLKSAADDRDVNVRNVLNTRRGTFEIDATSAMKLKTLKSISDCDNGDADESTPGENTANKDFRTEETPISDSPEDSEFKKYLVKISPRPSVESLNVCSKCSSSSSDVSVAPVESVPDLMCEVYNVPFSNETNGEGVELNTQERALVSTFRIRSIPTKIKLNSEENEENSPTEENTALESEGNVTQASENNIVDENVLRETEDKVAQETEETVTLGTDDNVNEETERNATQESQSNVHEENSTQQNENNVREENVTQESENNVREENATQESENNVDEGSKENTTEETSDSVTQEAMDNVTSKSEEGISEEVTKTHVTPDLAVPNTSVKEIAATGTDHEFQNMASVDSAFPLSEPLPVDNIALLDVSTQTEEVYYSSLKQRIQELEMALDEIEDVKKQHLLVTCDMAEQIEIYRQRLNAFEQKLDISERRRTAEVELAHQEHNLRENSLKDEIAALKENLDQQNAVLQRLKDDSEESNRLLLEKDTRINQQEEEISNLGEKVGALEMNRPSLDHSDSQTDELEELASYSQLQKQVSDLKQECQQMSEKVVQQKDAVTHVKSQLRATINHLQSLKDAALKQLQKQRKQLLQAIQERQQLYDAEVQIARQRREIEKKDDLLENQNSQIGVMQEKLASVEHELKSKTEVITEYEQKFVEKEKRDFWCQIVEEELESLQNDQNKSEKTLETLENQTVILNELQHKFQNLETIRSAVEDLKHNIETFKVKKEAKPEVMSNKEENQVQKLLSISEHTYLNLVNKLCDALKLRDLKGAKTLKLSSWLENEDLVEARRDDHRKILHTLERLKGDAYNAHEPAAHDWKRLMAESMYFSERKSSTPVCHSDDTHYQYLSEVLRRAQESLAREYYLKMPAQQRTVATAGSGRSERRSSSRERRVPLELKNGKILAMLDDKVNHKELLPNKHEYHKMDSKNGSTTKKSRTST